MLRNNRCLSIIVFSMFFSWLLAFPFQGQVLYALTVKYNTDAYTLTFGSVAAHFSGLLICGYLIRNITAANILMLISIVLCAAGSVPFFFPPTVLWHISLLTVSFLSGSCVAAWGFYFKAYTPPSERIKTAADGLIYSNVIMIIINIAAILVSADLGLALSIAVLGMAFFFQTRLIRNAKPHVEKPIPVTSMNVSPIKPLVFLCLFIAAITINSGLMYQVVNPAFAHHQWLVSWYWALPYIIAIYIVRNLPVKTNRNYILYVAITMIGLAFIGFMALDRSAASYLIINTLMLGAFGVCDLFWWSILGEMLDFHSNPARILGIGLSSNVLGILIGGMIGNAVVSSGSISTNPSILALLVVFIMLIILPLLHRHLSTLLKNHVFLIALYEMSPSKQKSAIDRFTMISPLTERESEITSLLLRGRTYRMIANELYLSENTVKTHIKNIYSKLNIRSKAELVNLMMQKEHSRSL